MNFLYVFVTAVTVSADALVAGFSVSLGKRNLLLPVTVAVVTYCLCLAASLAGTILRDFLEQYVKYIGAGILICLGIDTLLRRETPSLAPNNFSQYLATGFCVGLDGAIASLTLVMQGLGDIVFTPVLFAVMHFLAVFLGGCLAQNAKMERTNIFSAVMLFVLATAKLLDL